MADDNPKRSITDYIAVLSIILIVVMSYRHILDYFFTGVDTFSLIYTGRVHDFRDILRIFSEPLLNGTGFTYIGLFYRPISTLSFSMDYYIWGLNPFGYHLTDLILHVLVSVMVYFIIESLTNGNKTAALISAIVFIGHTGLAGNVSIIAQRQDVLAALFVLLSFYSFIKYHSAASKKKSFLFFSVIFYLIALGAKETSIVLLFLIFSYVMIFAFSDIKIFSKKIILSIKKCLPYIYATIIFLIWRTYVLKGMGGYQPNRVAPKTPLDIIPDYARYLTDPSGFLMNLPDSLIASVEQSGFFIPFLASLLLLVVGLAAVRLIAHDDNVTIKKIQALFAVFAVAAVCVILFYPLIAPYINQAIEQAYYGRGFNFLRNQMNSIDIYSPETYYLNTKNLIISLSFKLYVFFVIVFIGVPYHNGIKNYFIFLFRNNLLRFLLIWLFLPLAVFIATQSFSKRGIYLSVIPFSAILSMILAESFSAAVKKTNEGRFTGLPFYSSLFGSSALRATIMGILLFSYIAYSPLLNTESRIRYSPSFEGVFLLKLSEAVRDLPKDASLYINSVYSSDDAYAPHAIRSWLSLNYPESKFKVKLKNQHVPGADPKKLDLKIIKEYENQVVIYATLDTD
ncbi:MAG: hypothetical protein HY809_02380 [Nitrospirae bacterium]|nr:hypothetical protein [Nitrospirota bacterium]